MTRPEPPAAGDEMPELLPCPFCGSKNIRVYHRTPQCRDGWVVRCFGDCIVWPEAGEGFMEKVIAAWNTRATPSPGPAEPDRAGLVTMDVTIMACVSAALEVALRRSKTKGEKSLYEQALALLPKAPGQDAEGG